MAWAPDYVTAAELKAYERIPDTDDDAQVALAISAASRAVDRYCNRQFGLVASVEDRFYTPRWDKRRCRWVVDIDDLQTVVGLLVFADLDGSGDYATNLTDYGALKPVNAAAKSRPWTQLVVLPSSPVKPCAEEDSAQVTAKYGWTTVPTPVKQATLLQASRFLKRKDAPFGVAGSPDSGSEVRLLAKVDPDVAVVLGPYVRQWGAA